MTGIEVFTVPGDGWGERIRIRRRGVIYASRKTDNPVVVHLEIRRCSTWGLLVSVLGLDEVAGDAR